MSPDENGIKFRGCRSSPTIEINEVPTEEQIRKPATISPEVAKPRITRGPIGRKLDATDIALDLAWKQLSYIGLYFVILSLFRTTLRPLYTIQYLVHNGTLAGQGPWDMGLVFTGLLSVIGARAAIQIATISILKMKTTAIRKPIVIVRFAEQVWCVVYYSASAFVGITLLKYRADYGWSPEQLWTGFPHYYLDPYIKLYYLVALGYWLSQIYVINVEKRRKDHWQMFIHHIVTCALVIGSYHWCYSRIGHLVLILMDFVDVFLSLAKCIKYLGFNTLCDVFFMIFLVSWIVFRHIVYCYQIGWAFFKAPSIIEGNCAIDVDTNKPLACFGFKSFYTFAILALALQIITIMWFVLIVRVVIRVVRGQNAEEPRSDDEDDTGEE